jgi:hypothetical protein
MLIDKQVEFAASQTVTGSAASTHVIDLGEARNIGVGENLYLYISVDETMDDASDNSTVAPSLQTDDNESFASATTLRTYDTIAANTAQGTEYIYRLEPDSYERFIRIYWTVANGDLSAGKFSARVLLDVPKQTNYPSGFQIS